MLLGHAPITPNPPLDDVHLAISPTCGVLQRGSLPTDINVGINPHNIRTIVSFGDSYTDAGKADGSALDPAVICPPNQLAGGRSTNGPVWAEGVASEMNNATLLSYAQAGACIDLSIWPSNPRKLDLLMQMEVFLGQERELDPVTTLYSLFFGINDFGDSKHDGDHMEEAAAVLLIQVRRLIASPTNARNFLVLDVYGQGEHAERGERFKQVIYDGLVDMHATVPIQFAYVDFGHIWDGVLGPVPGYQAFGFTSMDQCTSCSHICDENGWCTDPDRHFYWFWGHPSKVTHKLMADYVMEVLENCHVQTETVLRVQG
ncbi:carbohydrate esterase family 16 protein [Cylindrobasidium torrendii FP15055 ss-10]|uniref:Carbohydrate esterase family 16 protein n=1 Tax=Cylindrobasidium torrendii FP15055 ss-10 TaxID=1314674 RepID=A0A0D7B909_9AGAR|nr:carbohydrate esterase family 16 protein [Cylindrobasidium torrendii FP15055 ss-10]